MWGNALLLIKGTAAVWEEILADRYCRNCGHELAEDDRFCPNCGTPVHKAAHVPTPEADVPLPPPPQQTSNTSSPPPQHSPTSAGFGAGFGAAIGWILG